MRWIYLAAIILFAAATIIFALQNFQAVTISFLGLDAHLSPFWLPSPTCWAQRRGAAYSRLCVVPTKGPD